MKIPPNLAEMYQQLTAKRPEMKVDGLLFVPQHEIWVGVGGYKSKQVKTAPYWAMIFESQHRSDEEAAALIRSHWEDELPRTAALCRRYEAPDAWNVIDMAQRNRWQRDCPDPITALYHFHMTHPANAKGE